MSTDQERSGKKARVHEPSWVGRAWLMGVVLSLAAACGPDEPPLVLRAQPGTSEPPSKPRPETLRTDTTPTTVSQSESTVSSKPEAVPGGEVTYATAERVFREGRYADATDLFEAYTSRTPENAWGHYMLGISAWRAGDLDRSETALRRTLELDPQHGKSLLNLTRVLLEQRETSDALEYARRVVELEPELGEGWRVLGNVQAELGAIDLAEDAYVQAIVLDPHDAWSMNNLGLLRIQHADPEGALGPLARATELRPEVALFQNNFGLALEGTGYLTDAAFAFRSAVESDPVHERARVSLERVEGRDPTSPLLSVELSELSTAFLDEVSYWQAEGGS